MYFFLPLQPLSVDPMPNSLNLHDENCMIDSKENCYWDHKSEMIKLVKTTSKKFVLEGKHYWVHCSLAYELVLLVIIQMSKYDISHIFVTILVKVVANHQHVQVLINGVSSEWPGWIGWWWNYIRFRAHLDDIRGMATTCTFRVIGVDSSTL